MNFFSKAYDKVNGIFGGEQDPQTQQNNQKKSSLSKWVKKGIFGVACGFAGAGLFAAGPAILAGLGTASTAVGTGFATAFAAGSATIPLGGVGLVILGATAVAGLGYLAHKRYQHNFAQKSIFSYNDVNDSGKLLNRTEENITKGNRFGYGRFMNHGKGKEAQKDYDDNDKTIRLLEAMEPQKEGHEIDKNLSLIDQVSEMTLSDKLAYLGNHEFTKQLDNNRSTRNNLVDENGIDPFKNITSVGLKKIAKEYLIHADDLEKHSRNSCPNKVEICKSLAYAAASVAYALDKHEEDKKNKEPASDIDDESGTELETLTERQKEKRKMMNQIEKDLIANSKLDKDTKGFVQDKIYYASIGDDIENTLSETQKKALDAAITEISKIIIPQSNRNNFRKEVVQQIKNDLDLNIINKVPGKSTNTTLDSWLIKPKAKDNDVISFTKN